MSSFDPLEFQLSDSDDDIIPPSGSPSFRRSARVLVRDSPWSSYPSDHILGLLEDQGIPVHSDIRREDLLTLAFNSLGDPSAFAPEDPAPPEPEVPAQPKKASRKRPAKSPPPRPAKRASKASAQPQPSTSQHHSSPADDQSVVQAIQYLTKSVKGLEARMKAFENPNLPSTSRPSTSSTTSPTFSAWPSTLLPSTSSSQPADVLPPAHSTAVPRSEASAVAGTHSFNLATALPAQIPARTVMQPLFAPKLSAGTCHRLFRRIPVNSLGVATRKYSGKKRLIFDMSSPHSDLVASINESIPLHPFSLYYASVDNAIHLIKVAGQGAWLSKADITDAFKIMPIHPSDWPLFGVKWESKFYFAVKLTFGCRSSPHIFNCLSEALCWILLNVCKLPFVLHLLDDFLLVDFPSSENSVLDTLKRVFSAVGVPLSEEKTMGPLTRLEFLGIMLDSVKMQASLPEEKLIRIRAITASFVSSRTVSKRELLSLLGHLNFAMRIIPQGRSFISRLLSLAHSVEKLSDLVLVDEGSRSDIAFWSQLLGKWNGISFFYNDVPESSDSLKIFTDAAPSVGFGGVFRGQWFAEKWPADFSTFALGSASCALHEIYPVVVASVLWGSDWSRKRITLFCNNAAVVGMINKGRSSSSIIMSLLRRLTWQSVLHNFIISAEHIPGHCNVLADALSRFRFQEFKQLCPSASPDPTPCPQLAEVILD
ncbi:uncharacterized protein LOC143141830 [Alosa pseudoharengus]|uniref:uncharacterized protein LOC143141830 n=1 Tax=Alosa pseudoharengus TaxID=34774 RepID=UPI003F890164